MWQIVNSDLPSATKEESYLPIAVIKSEYTAAPLANVYNSDLLDSGIIEDIDSETGIEDDDDLIIIPTPLETPPVYLINNGQQYTQGLNPELLTPGQFFLDITTGNLYIRKGGQYSFQRGLSTKAIQKEKELRTNLVKNVSINPSAILDITLKGDISWTRTLEDHPSGQLQLYILAKNIDLARKLFRNGSKIEIYNIPFRVNNYSEQAIPLKDFPIGAFSINVSLEGYWRFYVDKNSPIYDGFKSGAVNDKFEDPDCQLAPPGTGSDFNINNPIRSGNVVS